MPACLSCGFENTLTATVCVHCKRSLVDTHAASQTDATPPRRPTLLETLNRAASGSPNQAKQNIRPGSLVFYVENVAEPIIVDGVQQVILGRCTPEITAQIGVDLEPYQGAERGVSRNHAAVRCTSYGLEIEDLASTNGTYLNGEKIPAFMPRPLHAGDHLRLGLLGLTVYFRAESQESDPSLPAESEQRRRRP